MLDQSDLSQATGAMATRRSQTPPFVSLFGGVDVVVDWGGDAETLAHRLAVCAGPCGLRLAAIWKDDALVWPDATAPVRPGRAWRCRFISRAPAAEVEREIPRLLYLIAGTMRWTHAGKLDQADRTGDAA